MNKERVYRKWILRGPDRIPEPVALHCVRTIQPGERVLIDVPGGGGVGPASDRDPLKVAEDVRNGFVTVERAAAEYGVVVDPVTFAVDRDAMAKLRPGPESDPAQGTEATSGYAHAAGN
jgi:N-methylhydantoinase B